MPYRTPLTIFSTIEQDLNPRPFVVNDHPSVLVDEMMTIEPGENPTDLKFANPLDIADATWKKATNIVFLLIKYSINKRTGVL